MSSLPRPEHVRFHVDTAELIFTGFSIHADWPKMRRSRRGASTNAGESYISPPPSLLEGLGEIVSKDPDSRCKPVRRTGAPKLILEAPTVDDLRRVAALERSHGRHPWTIPRVDLAWDSVYGSESEAKSALRWFDAHAWQRHGNRETRHLQDWRILSFGTTPSGNAASRQMAIYRRAEQGEPCTVRVELRVRSNRRVRQMLPGREHIPAGSLLALLADRSWSSSLRLLGPTLAFSRWSGSFGRWIEAGDAAKIGRSIMGRHRGPKQRSADAARRDPESGRFRRRSREERRGAYFLGRGVRLMSYGRTLMKHPSNVTEPVPSPLVSLAALDRGGAKAPAVRRPRLSPRAKAALLASLRRAEHDQEEGNREERDGG